MNKYYILSLKKSNEFNELKNVLTTQNFKSTNALKFDLPIVIDPQNKTYTYLDYNVVKEIEAVKKTGKAKFYNCSLQEFENQCFNILTK